MATIKSKIQCYVSLRSYRALTRFVKLRDMKMAKIMYRMIQKDELNFVRLYFLNYKWYVNDLHNI